MASCAGPLSPGGPIGEYRKDSGAMAAERGRDTGDMPADRLHNRETSAHIDRMVVDTHAESATSSTQAVRKFPTADGSAQGPGRLARLGLRRRHHLFEIEDLPWVPRVLRDLITDVLREGIVLDGDAYGGVVPVLAGVIREQRATRVIDLCSGAGGPWTRLKAELGGEDAAIELVLTDKYPNLAAFRSVAERICDGATHYEHSVVDATRVPARLRGVRTLFTSFHHFRPHQAQALLRDARDQRAAICVFEFTERRWASILMTIPLAPVLTWLTVPRLRPTSITRLVLTYLIPIAPLSVMWDGVVSNLRTYREPELRAMVAELAADDYTWKVGQLPPTGERRAPVTYVVGQPHRDLEPRGPGASSP
jgi:hypothetical protein